MKVFIMVIALKSLYSQVTKPATFHLIIF